MPVMTKVDVLFEALRWRAIVMYKTLHGNNPSDTCHPNLFT